jgi:hypothetical protein
MLSFVNRSPEHDANKGIGISGVASLFASSVPFPSSEENHSYHFRCDSARFRYS